MRLVKKEILGLLFVLIAGLSCFASPVAKGEKPVMLKPTDLRCEYADNPLGIDTPAPHLSWKLASDRRGAFQRAYQVVASDAVRVLWDTGKTVSDATNQIVYAGTPLASAQQVSWKVRVWDKDGVASPWSAGATWTMGLLNAADWGAAHWIGGPATSLPNAPIGSHAAETTRVSPIAGTAAQTPSDSTLLRRNIVVRPGLRRALAFVCGLGQYEMTANGTKCGDDVLAPGWTKYSKTCLYDTRDLTPLLHPGANALGLLLGNGMYNVHGGRYAKFTTAFEPQMAICRIRLEYADGSSEWIGSDASWRAAPGPIVFSSVFGGEDYDARRVPAGWDKPGFQDDHWERATVRNGPGGALRGQGSAGPPIGTFERFSPIAAKPLRPGVVVYDLGQNASILLHLTVTGPSGSTVKVTPGELVHADGSVNRSSVGGGEAYWKYTLAGDGKPEDYIGKFFYHGCRYLQVECHAEGGSALPEVLAITGVVVGSKSPPIGEFACSSERFNRIYSLIRWAQRSNMMSVMTDCPHRERLGWLEEDHLNGPSLRYNFDLDALFRKIENDMADSQTDDGLIPSIAPEYPVFSGGFRDSPEWGSAFLMVPWQQYEFTGDLSLFQHNYDAMKRYVAHIASRSTGDIVDYGLGDWYDIGPNPSGYSQLTPVALTATAFYYQDAVILARAGAALGRTDDARHYQALVDRIRTAFNAKFFNPGTGQYATGSQTANAIPLVMGLAPDAARGALVEAIVRDVAKHGNAVTAGDIGYRYLLQALALGGRSDIIFAMNDQSEKPGYGYQLRAGATSLTEAWNADPSSSQNHFMLGQLMEWLYAGLAGIQGDPEGPGFRKIIVKPSVVGDLSFVRARYDSVRGPIVSAWKRDGSTFTLNVTIPPNTSATIYLPTTDPSSVRESGATTAKADGVTFTRIEGTTSVYRVGSGAYRFTCLVK